jgi:hypothetical protein
MSRYIDADTLIRYGKCGTLVYWEDIENAPSIDIVRCQDCRHRYMDADLQVWTCTYGLMIKPDGFCNYGEVRDE